MKKKWIKFSLIGLVIALTAMTMLALVPTRTPVVHASLGNKCIEEQGNLSFKEWDAKIKYRGIDFKYDYQLEEAAACYERKIPLSEEMLLEKAADSEQSLIEKVDRLKEKYACVLKEQEFRKEGKVKREMHGTVYYIDLNAGNDANNGLSTTTPWLTVEKYTTATVRSAGDIAWVRANTDQILAATVAFDEDGTINNYIEVRGCSATAGEDPWGDASNIKPIFDFDAGAYYLNLNTDNYWRFYQLDVRNNNHANGLLYSGSSYGTIVDSCRFHINATAGGRGVYTANSNGIKILNSAFDDLCGSGIYIGYSSVSIENSTFDGGGTYSTDYGLYVYSGTAYCNDCKFGDTATHDNADIYLNVIPGTAYLRNCKLASTIEVGLAANALGNFVASEDHDQVKGAQKTYYYFGTVERSSTIQLDSLDSAKMTPTSYVGSIWALNLSNNPLDGDYQIWCPASSTTITIKARETAAWTTDPTATQFYFEAWYLDQATGGHRAIQTSSQALSGTTEVSFTMTFTPAQAGWVYITCNLKKYEEGKSVNVSVKPTIS